MDRGNQLAGMRQEDILVVDSPLVADILVVDILVVDILVVADTLVGGNHVEEGMPHEPVDIVLHEDMQLQQHVQGL